MRDDFGMPTLAGLETLEDNARLCADLGLSFVELNMNLPHCQLGALDAAELGRLQRKYGIYFTLHLDEDLNPCDFNGAVAAAYRDTVLRSIAMAKETGMPVLNMHMNPGVHFKLPDQVLFLFEKYLDRYLCTMKAFRDACAQAAGDSGIKICVENTNGFTPHEQAAVELLLESSAFALTLDIGHAHLAGYRDAPFYEKHVRRVAHTHIHDANEKTCHLPLGAGALDIPHTLAFARAHGCRRVIEVKAPMELAASVATVINLEGEFHARA